MDGSSSMARHGPLGRFDPSDESAFQTWYVQRLRHLGIAMGAASALAWLINPLLLTVYMDTDHVGVAFFVCWGVNIPALIAGIFYMRKPDPRRAVAVGTALVMLTAADTIAVLLPLVLGLEPTALALAATFFGLLAPVVQLPFRHTLLTGLLITAAGEVSLLSAAESFDQNVFLACIFIPVSALIIGPAMAFANERDLRTRFANERVIEHQRQLIRRYVPGSVASRIESGDSSVDHPRRCRITAFSSDVVGFTAMADRIDPEALAHIINEYLGAVSDLIERHGGTVTEFAGDGVMAIFGAPEESDPADQVSSLSTQHESSKRLSQSGAARGTSTAPSSPPVHGSASTPELCPLAPSDQRSEPPTPASACR